MAAFLERGLGRVTSRTGAALLRPGDSSTMAEVTIEAGAAGTGAGYVLLLGSVNALARSGCPCSVMLTLVAPSGAVGRSTRFDVPGDLDEAGNAENGGSLVATAPLPADAVRSFRLVAGIASDTTVNISLGGTLTALYVPFGPDADATAAYELSCPLDDGYEDNDARAAAASLSVGTSFNFPVSGIACPGDDDYFRLTAYAGTTLTAQLNFVHADGDVDLYLENSAGTVLVPAESNSDHELITFNVTQTGTYYLRVHLHQDFYETGNTYRLFTRNSGTAVAPDEGPASPEAIPGPPTQE